MYRHNICQKNTYETALKKALKKHIRHCSQYEHDKAVTTSQVAAAFFVCLGKIPWMVVHAAVDLEIPDTGTGAVEIMLVFN